jgi:hypothetical protein
MPLSESQQQAKQFVPSQGVHVPAPKETRNPQTGPIKACALTVGAAPRKLLFFKADFATLL